MVGNKEMEKQMLKVQSLAHKHRKETAKLDIMSREKYGKVSYGSKDKDQLIDALDYGISIIPFKLYDNTMKEINSDIK